jgi:hypothetical protein
MVREVETFPPVTMGHIRGHGCRDLLVWRRRRGMIGAHVRPGLSLELSTFRLKCAVDCGIPPKKGPTSLR